MEIAEFEKIIPIRKPNDFKIKATLIRANYPVSMKIVISFK